MTCVGRIQQLHGHAADADAQHATGPVIVQAVVVGVEPDAVAQAEGRRPEAEVQGVVILAGVARREGDGSQAAHLGGVGVDTVGDSRAARHHIGGGQRIGRHRALGGIDGQRVGAVGLDAACYVAAIEVVFTLCYW